MAEPLPVFPYHRDPVASGSIRASNEQCECCNRSRGMIYTSSVYSLNKPESLCPWCIADGSAADKYDATFIDGHFCDADYDMVELSSDWHRQVFCCTIGFATFNPIGWWVHCDEPAEYVTRNEPYEMVFECRKCNKRQIIPDYD